MPQPQVKARRVYAPPPTATATPVTLTVVKGDATWSEVALVFLADCKRTGLTPPTLKNYRYILLGKDRTMQFIADQGIVTPADFTASMLKGFGSELQGKVSTGTLIQHHRILKTFLGWAMREGYDVDPAVLQVKGYKEDRVRPDTFTDKELGMIRGKAKGRDLILFDLMLTTGLRLTEVANLTLDDIDLTTESGTMLQVRRGKGGKARAVVIDPITSGRQYRDTKLGQMYPKMPRLYPRLRDYIAKERKDSTSRAIFLSTRLDGQGERQAMTAEAIASLFKAIANTFKNSDGTHEIHMYPHKCRHTFATRALRAGVDIVSLQMALGHTAIGMTMRYVHYNDADLLRGLS